MQATADLIRPAPQINIGTPHALYSEVIDAMVEALGGPMRWGDNNGGGLYLLHLYASTNVAMADAAIQVRGPFDLMRQVLRCKADLLPCTLQTCCGPFCVHLCATPTVARGDTSLSTALLHCPIATRAPCAVCLHHSHVYTAKLQSIVTPQHKSFALHLATGLNAYGQDVSTVRRRGRKNTSGTSGGRSRASVKAMRHTLGCPQCRPSRGGSHMAPQRPTLMLSRCNTAGACDLQPPGQDILIDLALLLCVGVGAATCCAQMQGRKAFQLILPPLFAHTVTNNDLPLHGPQEHQAVHATNGQA